MTLNSSLARQRVEVEFFGHTSVSSLLFPYHRQPEIEMTFFFLLRAHAAMSPWEGQNALDAAVIAYTNISMLRQQLQPTYRIHGIIVGNEDWTPNSKLGF